MKMIIIVISIVIILLTTILFIVVSPIWGQNKESLELNADKDHLYKIVDTLTKMQPPRNFSNTIAMEHSAQFIYNEMMVYNKKAEFQTYSDGNFTFRNVSCIYNKGAGKRVVIGAHYDVFGDLPGADDNASGIAGLLELVRLVNEHKPQVNYEIEFVAFNTEEPPYFRTDKMGSAVHAKSLKEANVKIELMICLEMIGFFSEDPSSQKYPVKMLNWFYPNTGNYILIAGRLHEFFKVRNLKKLMSRSIGLDVRSFNVPASLGGIDLSDQRNYWGNGYKAVMITNTSFYRNPNYHKDTDTIETLDFNKMSEVVKGVYYALENF